MNDPSYPFGYERIFDGRYARDRLVEHNPNGILPRDWPEHTVNCCTYPDRALKTWQDYSDVRLYSQ